MLEVNHESASISFVIKDSVENVDDFVEDLRVQFCRNKGSGRNFTVSGVGGLIGGAESQYTLVVNGSEF